MALNMFNLWIILYILGVYDQHISEFSLEISALKDCFCVIPDVITGDLDWNYPDNYFKVTPHFVYMA